MKDSTGPSSWSRSISQQAAISGIRQPTVEVMSWQPPLPGPEDTAQREITTNAHTLAETDKCPLEDFDQRELALGWEKKMRHNERRIRVPSTETETETDGRGGDGVEGSSSPGPSQESGLAERMIHPPSAARGRHHPSFATRNGTSTRRSSNGLVWACLVAAGSSRDAAAAAAAARLRALLHLHGEVALLGGGELVDEVLLVELEVGHLLPVQLAETGYHSRIREVSQPPNLHLSLNLITA